VDDVERYTERILRSMRSPPPPGAGIRVRITSAQPKDKTRESSTPAAYALRQHEHNSLKPGERRALRQLNQHFYETRRLVRTDPRFTRQERAQLVAVLVFERMKAKQAITHPQLHQESTSMRSAEIRALVDRQQKPLPNNSISGPDRLPPARQRIQRLIARAQEAVDEFKSSGRTQTGSAQDMYTKRARFSQDVHYLDKKSDKTVFVDTGKSINLRKHGMSEAGVAVALDLARERFGSTLTIKGSEAFKRTIVEVAAKRGLDIHFTDPQMNERLAEHKAALAIEQEGQRIERGTVEMGPAEVEQEVVPESATPALSSAIRGELLEHGAAPYQHDPAKDVSYFVKLQTNQGERTMWGKDFRQLMEQGQFQPGEQIRLEDHGTQPVDVVHELADGTTETKVAQRRSWTVERVGMAIDRDQSVAVAPIEPATPAVAELQRDTRLDGDRILKTAVALREAGFDEAADVFAEAVLNENRWPDALANLRQLAKAPSPDTAQWSKEVAHNLYQGIERELYKHGVDYQTVADTGRVIEPSAPTADRSRDIPF
jgi:hypothetical protein